MNKAHSQDAAVLSPRERVTNEAANWVVRLEAGVGEAEQDAFIEWLAADSRHGDEYERLRMLWSRLDRLTELGKGRGSPDPR